MISFFDKIDKNTVTVIISTITAIIAWLTFLSQKKTQENTKSLVKSSGALVYYLNNLANNFILIEFLLYYSYKLLSQKKDLNRVSKYLASLITIDINDFNNQLFYENESMYRVFSKFKGQLLQLSKQIDLFSEINSDDSRKEMKNKYLLYSINNTLLHVYQDWYIIYMQVLSHEYKDQKCFLIRLFNSMTKTTKSQIQSMFDNSMMILLNGDLMSNSNSFSFNDNNQKVERQNRFDLKPIFIYDEYPKLKEYQYAFYDSLVKNGFDSDLINIGWDERIDWDFYLLRLIDDNFTKERIADTVGYNLLNYEKHLDNFYSEA